MYCSAVFLELIKIWEFNLIDLLKIIQLDFGQKIWKLIWILDYLGKKIWAKDFILLKGKKNNYIYTKRTWSFILNIEDNWIIGLR